MEACNRPRACGIAWNCNLCHSSRIELAFYPKCSGNSTQLSRLTITMFTFEGNKPHPSAKEPPFSEGDPRRVLAMKSCDPRIHFSLVCGAKVNECVLSYIMLLDNKVYPPWPLLPLSPHPQSCPSIQVYSSKNLDRGLNAAARSFCSQEVRVDVGARRVSLSKIFEWYATDFGSNERELLQWVPSKLTDSSHITHIWRSLPKLILLWLPLCRWLTTHLEGESRRGLEQLLGNQAPITIESTEYNWNLNKLWGIYTRKWTEKANFRSECRKITLCVIICVLSRDYKFIQAFSFYMMAFQTSVSFHLLCSETWDWWG